MNEQIADADLAHEMAKAGDSERTKAVLARTAAMAVEATHGDGNGEALANFEEFENSKAPHMNNLAEKMLEGNALAAAVGPEGSEKLVEGYKDIADYHESEANRAEELVHEQHESDQ